MDLTNKIVNFYKPWSNMKILMLFHDIDVICLLFHDFDVIGSVIPYNNCIPFSIQVLNTYIKPMEKIYTRRPLILYIYLSFHSHCGNKKNVLLLYLVFSFIRGFYCKINIQVVRRFNNCQYSSVFKIFVCMDEYLHKNRRSQI
jgi:hypothetical protein